MNVHSQHHTNNSPQFLSKDHNNQYKRFDEEQYTYAQMCSHVLSLVAQELNPVRQARLIARAASAIGKGTAVIFVIPQNTTVLTPLSIIHTIDDISDNETGAFTASSSGVTVPANTPSITIGEGIAGKVAKYGQSICFPDTNNTPQFHIESVALDAALCPTPVQIFYAMPIRYQNTILGVIEILQPHPAPGLGQLAREALQSLADQAALIFAITAREQQPPREVYTDIHSSEAEYRALVHDVQTGPLASIQSMLQMTEYLDAVLTTDEDKARQVMRTLHEELLQTSRDIAQIPFTHPPRWTNTMPLATAVKLFTADLFGSLSVQCEVISACESDRQLKDQQYIFSIIREAFYNVVYHAKGTACRITLREIDAQLIIQIHDNGCGFDVDSILAQYSAGKLGGLYFMFETARNIGGTLRIASSIDHGTRIELIVALATDSTAQKVHSVSSAPGPDTIE